MKNISFWIFLIIVIFLFSAAGGFIYRGHHLFAEAVEHHVHGWAPWKEPIHEERFDTYIQFRQCTNCGEAQRRTVK